jgi:hypothetical protein
MTEKVSKRRSQRRYNLPVIGHFRNRSIRYSSILEAQADTGISYHLIFENCIDKIRSARGTQWEYENGRHWLKYRSQYIRQVRKYTRWTGFNG